MNPRPNEMQGLKALLLAASQQAVQPTRLALVVNISTQSLALFDWSWNQRGRGKFPRYYFVRRYVCSTSRFGIGSVANSNCTPLGLHCIAEKLGGGQPVGTIFKGRVPVGLTWKREPEHGGERTVASIVHRILWLAGLEAGRNQGGNVDTHARYIYIHGYGDETTLGRPMSHGCIHLAAADLIPLFDRVPSGTLVWIARN